MNTINNMSEEFVLPTTPSIKLDQSPTELIIFSKPKTGKTALLAALPNCLILDFEEGSGYVKAMRASIDSIQKLNMVAAAIKAANFPYEYIAVDTASALEDLCVGYAEDLYSKSPMGKYWYTPKDSASQSGKQKYGTIIGLPDGAGYHWLRLAYDNVMNLIRKLAPRIVIAAHVKDIFLDKGDGTQFTGAELDLTGKIKRSAAAKSDSIGYLYRKGNQNILSFKTSDTVICGARPEHLSNKDIILSEKKDGEITTHWDKIFLDLSPTKK